MAAPTPSSSLTFLVSVQDDESLQVARSTVCAVASLAALQTPAPPLARLGLCGLRRGGGAGSRVQLLVKLRPSAPLDVRSVVLAANRLQAGPAFDEDAQNGLLTTMALVRQERPAGEAQPRDTVFVVADALRGPPSSALGVALAQDAAAGVAVHLVLLVRDTGALEALRANLLAWEEAERRHGSLAVTVVEEPHRWTPHLLARELLDAAVPAAPPLPVSLDFRSPLVGHWRSPDALGSLKLECWAASRPLHYGEARCAAAGAAPPLWAEDLATVRFGAGGAATFHLETPFARVVPCGAAALAVAQRVPEVAVSPVLRVGPLFLLSAAGGGAALPRDGGEALDVTTAEVAGTLALALRCTGQALLCTSNTDLETGMTGLMRCHYLVSPMGDGRFPLSARRLAALEELFALEQQVATPRRPPPKELAASVVAALDKVESTDEPDYLVGLSCRCHELLSFLASRSRPPPPPPLPREAQSAHAAAAAAKGGAKKRRAGDRPT